MLLPIDALRLTRKNMKERQGRLEGYFHTIHEKPHLAPASLLEHWSGMCTQHNLWRNYFLQLLLFSKWGEVI